MDIFVFLSRFIYRIRYILFFGVLITSILAIFITDRIPKKYVVTTTIFTGITSQASLDDPSANADWNTANNAHDNIINLVQSKSTLQSVSANLLAQHLIYGDPNKDNKYISAQHYRELLAMTPSDVLALVDKSSIEKTAENFNNYRTEDRSNFIFAVFSWGHPHYSYLALKNIQIKRKGNSDMIELSYECNDPGIAMNTLALLNNELSLRYETLILSVSNDVVKYFEEQLVLAAQRLSLSEDELVDFNIANNIINYEEQTKHLASLNNNFEARYEDILLANRSSRALLKELESQMNTRTLLVKENKTFLNALSDISTLNGKIAEIEIFGGVNADNEILSTYKNNLADTEKKIRTITDTIDAYKYTKEGVVIENIADRWLAELVQYEKSKAELEVMLKRREEINTKYSVFSPVGPNLNRKDREVTVAEQQYLTLLHHLGLAKLKQKNVLLNSGTLQIVTPPEFPLLTMPRKRELYVTIAFIGAIIFIIGFFLLLEFLDRTIRDGHRAERLTSGKVIGAFPKEQNFRFRNYTDEIHRMATSSLVNILNKYIDRKEVMTVNLLSVEHGEGKSFIADQLYTYWEEMGFAVKYISYENDFITDSKPFIQASGVSDLIAEDQSAFDIIIVEYTPIKYASIPKSVLNSASVNLLILNAERIWKANDQVIFNNLCDIVSKVSILICLNNTDREATEEYTGQLPPYTFLRNISYKLFNFGLTAKKR